MKHIKFIMMTTFAVLAFSAVASAAAQAEEAPFFSVGGARLKAGETAEFTAKATEPFILKTATIKIECKIVKVKAGAVLVGSEPGEPGTNKETVIFEECAVTGNGTPCSVTVPIQTEPLKTELVEDAATHKKLLVLFSPVTAPKFATLTFTGSGCVVKSATVNGQLLAQAFTDTATPAQIELGVTNVEELSGLLKFSEAESKIKKVFKYKAGVSTETTVETLEAFGVAATLAGTSLISLTSGKNWSALA